MMTAPILILVDAAVKSDAYAPCLAMLDRFRVPYEVVVGPIRETPGEFGFCVLFGNVPPVPSANFPMVRVPLDTGDADENLTQLRNAVDALPAIPTLAVGRAGAVNAALFAIAVLALSQLELRIALADFRAKQTGEVLQQNLAL